MLNQLGDKWILEPKSSRPESAMHEFSWKTALDAAFPEGCLKDGLHNGVQLSAGHGSGHQGILNSLHDGCSKTVPCFRWVQLLGSQSISPLNSLGAQIFDLVPHAAVRPDLDPQGFIGLIDFQPLI